MIQPTLDGDVRRTGAGILFSDMAEQSICAVIVTYHPLAAMIEKMPGVLAQAQGLVVVDNNSNSEAIRLLRAASHTHGFALIQNEDNLGIAEALNQGVSWARSRNFQWVVLFDQDSTIPDGFIGQMLACWKAHPGRDRIGSFHPRYVDPHTGYEPDVLRADDGGPVSSMTSGALMPLWIFARIGLFSSEYFIDQVDIEYALRIRAAGYLVADSKEAVLLHSAGQPEKLSFLGFGFRPTHHSVLRRYYISRNRVVLYRKYFRVFPRWILQAIYASLKESVKCLIAEQDRLQKLRAILLGSWDGLAGKMGKKERL